MRRGELSLVLPLILFTTVANASEAPICEDVLKLDLRDRFFGYEERSASYAFWSWACTHSYQEVKHSTNLGIGVTLPTEVPVPLNANFTQQDFTAFVRDSCNAQSLSKSEYLRSTFSRDAVSQYMSGAIAAWERCVQTWMSKGDTDKSGVALRLVPEQGQPNRLRLSIQYKGPHGTEPDIELTVGGLFCEQAPNNPKGAQKIKVGRDRVAAGAEFICNRTIAKIPTQLKCPGGEAFDGWENVTIIGTAKYARETHVLAPVSLPRLDSACACDTRGTAVDLYRDPANCGRCSNACPNKCEHGSCVPQYCIVWDTEHSWCTEYKVPIANGCFRDKTALVDTILDRAGPMSFLATVSGEIGWAMPGTKSCGDTCRRCAQLTFAAGTDAKHWEAKTIVNRCERSGFGVSDSVAVQPGASNQSRSIRVNLVNNLSTYECHGEWHSCAPEVPPTGTCLNVFKDPAQTQPVEILVKAFPNAETKASTR
jgi:hypothetical protein